MNWPSFSLGAISCLTAMTGLVITYLKFTNRIKVIISYGFVTYQNELGDTQILIEVQNYGHREVRLVSIGLCAPEFLNFVNPSGDVTLPHVLKPNYNCHFWIALEEIENYLKKNPASGKIKLKGYCNDSIGKRYKSNAIKL